MERIRTGLEVILALFLKLRLLKKTQTLYTSCSTKALKSTRSHGPEVPCPPRSDMTDYTLGVALASRQHTELSSKDAAHI